MKQRTLRPAVLVLTVLLLAAASSAAMAQKLANQDMATDNILVTVRVGKIEGGQKVVVKAYTLIVAAGTPGSKLLAGKRVPLPTGGKDGGVSYQNIGFTSNVTAWMVDKKTIRVVADIENSELAPGDGDAPVVETRQLSVNATLTPGQPLELVRGTGITDDSGYVEMEVTLPK